MELQVEKHLQFACAQSSSTIARPSAMIELKPHLDPTYRAVQSVDHAPGPRLVKGSRGQQSTGPASVHVFECSYAETMHDALPRGRETRIALTIAGL